MWWEELRVEATENLQNWESLIGFYVWKKFEDMKSWQCLVEQKTVSLSAATPSRLLPAPPLRSLRERREDGDSWGDLRHRLLVDKSNQSKFIGTTIHITENTNNTYL